MIISLWPAVKNIFSDVVGVIELNSFQGDLQKTCRLYELNGNLMIIENYNHKTALATLVYLILFLRNRFRYFHILAKMTHRKSFLQIVAYTF